LSGVESVGVKWNGRGNWEMRDLNSGQGEKGSTTKEEKGGISGERILEIYRRLQQKS